MQIKDAYTQVLISLQKEYNKANEILDLTTQMEDMVRRNDTVSFEMLLEMRRDVIVEFDSIVTALKESLNTMPEEVKDFVEHCKSSKSEAVETRNKEEQMILEAFARIYRVFEKIVSIDKVVSLKIGGENSFYGAK